MAVDAIFPATGVGAGRNHKLDLRKSAMLYESRGRAIISAITGIAATFAFAAAAGAQVASAYTFVQNVGSYVPIVGGTLLGVATPTQTLDDVTFSVTLPFAFVYDNMPQTLVQVQTNGHLAFGAGATATTYTPMSSSVVTPGFVAACGRDLQGGYVCAGTRTLGSNLVTNVSAVGPLSVGDRLVGSGIASGATVTAIAGNTVTMSAPAIANSVGAAMTAYGPWSNLRCEVLGSAPDRVFVAQWSNFRRFGTTLTTVQDMNLNFQIRLHETGLIECAYGNCSPGVTTTSAIHQVGLRGPTNAFATNVNSRSNTKGANDWGTSGPSVANSSGQVFNGVAPANVIPNGLIYQWFPGGSGGIAMFGVQHTALGSASLSSPANDRLIVAGMSGSGLDGVSILCPNAEGQYVVWEDLDDVDQLPVGAFLDGEIRGATDAGHNGTLASLRMTKTASRSLDPFPYRMSADFGSIGVAGGAALFFTGEVLQGVVPVPDFASMRFDWADFCNDLEGMVIGAEVGLGNPLVAAAGTVIFTIARHSTCRVGGPGGQVFLGDTVAFVYDAPGPRITRIDELRVRCAGISTMTIVGERMVYFGHAHAALGSATLNAGAGALSIGNLGNSGQDGVEITPNLTMNMRGGLAAEVGQISAAALATGAFLRVSARGNVNGVAGVECGSHTVTRLASGMFELTADHSAVGSSAMRVDVLLQGVLQFSMPSHVGPIAQCSTLPIPTWDCFCWMYPSAPQCIKWDFPFPLPVTLLGAGGGTFNADSIRVVPSPGPSSVQPFGIDAMRLTCSGISAITLTDERTSDSLVASRGAGCPGSSMRAPENQATSRPLIGGVFELELRALGPSHFGVQVLGFSDLNPSLDLSSLGAPGCSLHQAVDFAQAVIGSGAGIATLAVPIPNAPSLAGVDLFAQGVALDPGVNQLGLTTSNGLRLTLAQ